MLLVLSNTHANLLFYFAPFVCEQQHIWSAGCECVRSIREFRPMFYDCAYAFADVFNIYANLMESYLETNFFPFFEKDRFFSIEPEQERAIYFSFTNLWCAHTQYTLPNTRSCIKLHVTSSTALSGLRSPESKRQLINDSHFSCWMIQKTRSTYWLFRIDNNAFHRVSKTKCNSKQYTLYIHACNHKRRMASKQSGPTWINTEH